MKNTHFIHAAVLTSALALVSLAQEVNTPCPALSPDQLAVLLQMMGTTQRQAGPAVSAQMLQSWIQALQQMQNGGMTPSAGANDVLASALAGAQTAQALSGARSMPNPVADQAPVVYLRQAGRQANLTPGERRMAIVKSDANDIAEIFKNEAWLQASQIVVRAVNEEITKMMLSNRELGKWLWRFDSTGAVGRIGGKLAGKLLSRSRKPHVYEVEFVPGLASGNIASAGSPFEFVVQPQPLSGYEPVLFHAERRDRDGIRVLSSRKVELTPHMAPSGPDSVERELVGTPQEKRVQLDVQAAPDGTLVIRPAQPLEPGEYALVFVKRDTKVPDSLPGAFDLRIGR